MGMRFRKSFSLGGARLNISKSGIGYSVGTKGARVTKTAKGGIRTTASIPGTGISYVKESGKGSTAAPSAVNSDTPYSFLAIVLRILSIITFVFSGILAIVLLPIGLLGIGLGVIEWVAANKLAKKSKAQTKEEIIDDDFNIEFIEC